MDWKFESPVGEFRPPQSSKIVILSEVRRQPNEVESLPSARRRDPEFLKTGTSHEGFLAANPNLVRHDRAGFLRTLRLSFRRASAPSKEESASCTGIGGRIATPLNRTERD